MFDSTSYGFFFVVSLVCIILFLFAMSFAETEADYFVFIVGAALCGLGAFLSLRKFIEEREIEGRPVTPEGVAKGIIKGILKLILFAIIAIYSATNFIGVITGTGSMAEYIAWLVASIIGYFIAKAIFKRR